MAGYTGPRCCQLDLGACNVALHPNNTWTWGAAARWMKGGGVEVMAMGLQNQCGINNYRYNGYILRASATSPFAPFSVIDTFGPGTPPRFDATEVEDPNLMELPDQSGTVMFYTGAWVNGDHALNCTEHDQPQPDSAKLANAQRIGVAFRANSEGVDRGENNGGGSDGGSGADGDGSSDDGGGSDRRDGGVGGGGGWFSEGGWQRASEPVLSTRAGAWDSTRVSNPAGVVLANGSVLLAYRGNGAGRGGIGMAIAPHWRGPYTHLLDQPLFDGYAEDPTLYLDPHGLVHMIAHGELPPAPTFNVGIHSVSADGVTWSTPRVAYTLYTNWSASVPVPRPSLGRREAPQMLLSDKGTPVALFNAAMPCKCGYGDHREECNWGDECRSFTMVCAFRS